MARNLIGTVTTDSNGEATFTYTGGGLGKIGFSAEHGTFQSETYEIHDDIFYCKGTTGNINQYWSAETGLTSTPDSEGNLLENSASGGKSYTADIPISSSQLDYTTPLCIEFDCISLTGARIFLTSSSGGSNVDRSFASYITGNNHVKMIVRENTYDLIVDDEVKISNQSHTLVNPVAVKFVVNANSNLKYANFEIYPI